MSKHQLLFLDFETFYHATDYTLKTLPPPNYILDSRFETILCAAAVDNQPSFIVDGPDFGKFLSNFDPATTTTVTFNALFDNAILAWRYNFVPAHMFDSMGMARALRGHLLKRASLAVVAPTLGVGEKGDAIIKVSGMRRQDIIDAGLWQEYCTYSLGDNDLSRGIFFQLIGDFPTSERRIMDMVLRCGIEPRFRGDIPMLKEHIKDIWREKELLLANASLACNSKGGSLESVTQLMSAPKFKALLESMGVTVENKISPKGKSIPALAKTDDFMASLEEHEDIRVQALAAARLGHKSTIEETRSIKFLKIANLLWPAYCHGNLPMPLRYGAAHTHRLGGDWGMNVQNMPSSRQKKSKLRRAVMAPPGHTVVTIDLGQIECRLSAWLCSSTALLKQFADKLDPYAILGSAIFGFTVDRKVHKVEGFIGKTGILGLGYGCGADHFYDMVCKMARAQKLDLKGQWTPELAAKSVTTYRKLHWPMQTGWRGLDAIIAHAWLGTSAPMKFGPGDVVEIGHGVVHLPNGMDLNYGDPKLDAETGEYTYKYGPMRHKLYGAKFLENITQALARIVVMNAALRIADRLREPWGRFVLQAHDELVYIIPNEKLDYAKTIIHEEMVRRPSWARDLPLTADIGAGASYGEAK